MNNPIKNLVFILFVSFALHVPTSFAFDKAREMQDQVSIALGGLRFEKDDKKAIDGYQAVIDQVRNQSTLSSSIRKSIYDHIEQEIVLFNERLLDQLSSYLDQARKELPPSTWKERLEEFAKSETGQKYVKGAVGVTALLASVLALYFQPWQAGQAPTLTAEQKEQERKRLERELQDRERAEVEAFGKIALSDKVKTYTTGSVNVQKLKLMNVENSLAAAHLEELEKAYETVQKLPKENAVKLSFVDKELTNRITKLPLKNVMSKIANPDTSLFLLTKFIEVFNGRISKEKLADLKKEYEEIQKQPPAIVQRFDALKHYLDIELAKTIPLDELVNGVAVGEASPTMDKRIEILEQRLAGQLFIKEPLNKEQFDKLSQGFEKAKVGANAKKLGFIGEFLDLEQFKNLNLDEKIKVLSADVEPALLQRKIEIFDRSMRRDPATKQSIVTKDERKKLMQLYVEMNLNDSTSKNALRLKPIINYLDNLSTREIEEVVDDDLLAFFLSKQGEPADIAQAFKNLTKWDGLIFAPDIKDYEARIADASNVPLIKSIDFTFKPLKSDKLGGKLLFIQIPSLFQGYNPDDHSNYCGYDGLFNALGLFKLNPTNSDILVDEAKIKEKLIALLKNADFLKKEQFAQFFEQGLGLIKGNRRHVASVRGIKKPWVNIPRIAELGGGDISTINKKITKAEVRVEVDDEHCDIYERTPSGVLDTSSSYYIEMIKLYIFKNKDNLTASREVYVANSSLSGSHWFAFDIEKIKHPSRDESVIVIRFCDSLGVDRSKDVQEKLSQ